MRFDLPEARKEFGRLSRERHRLEQEVVGGLSRKKLVAGTPVEKYKACTRETANVQEASFTGRPTMYPAGKTRKQK